MPSSLILSRESTTTMADDDECAICLRNMEIGDRYRVLSVCGHWFHDHCIVTWLTKSRTCPLCRASATATTIDDIV
ncbi:RING-H2 finger protein ATL48 [Acorus gramineus]|uniref:RING-H2 finger protein ATL48 n=1 Tax=Acorus gramineus TaxID=55184 RepID=A0AAV9BJ21_ACOGR|nr:RING-H2 finger protein ATL48 [Acorus gramineus]